MSESTCKCCGADIYLGHRGYWYNTEMSGRDAQPYCAHPYETPHEPMEETR